MMKILLPLVLMAIGVNAQSNPPVVTLPNGSKLYAAFD